jgi:hypothetical protein
MGRVRRARAERNSRRCSRAPGARQSCGYRPAVVSRRTFTLSARLRVESRAESRGGVARGAPGRGSGTRRSALTGAGETPRPRDPGRVAPNTTVPLAGLFRNAVTQSVGAGCFAGGTPLTQMRHKPAGGRWDAGTSTFRPAPCANSADGPSSDNVASNRSTRGVFTRVRPSRDDWRTHGETPRRAREATSGYPDR